ncbi:TetR/AcrR family transcriptional regulator [Listeria costaricensis]|uniref:TetR/AcrR family transcriptional regulator n=1 Tax=Listeria costaricensis TaxID=2026604 RepID=UPI000C072157|nr:TetR/AcrR family transcriptional regulator [Listeria costaricensis]
MKLSRTDEMLFTRARILETARDLFMEKGYRAVTTREIAKQIPITQPALYHHFKDKETLYAAVITELTSKIQIDLTSIAQKPLAIEEKLKTMILVLLEKHPTNIILMINDILNEMKPENQFLMYQLWRQAYLEPFMQVFATLEKNELLRPTVTSEQAARFCLSAVTPLFSKQSPFDHFSLDERLSTQIDFVLHGLYQS